MAESEALIAFMGDGSFTGGCSFREDAKRRKERVFLPGD